VIGTGLNADPFQGQVVVRKEQGDATDWAATISADRGHTDTEDSGDP